MIIKIVFSPNKCMINNNYKNKKVFFQQYVWTGLIHLSQKLTMDTRLLYDPKQKTPFCLLSYQNIIKGTDWSLNFKKLILRNNFINNLTLIEYSFSKWLDKHNHWINARIVNKNWKIHRFFGGRAFSTLRIICNKFFCDCGKLM